MKRINPKTKLIVVLCIVGLLLLAALVCRYATPQDPYKTNISKALLPPNGTYPFGTDNLGRDVLSRVMAGASTSIFSALAVVGIIFAVGVSLGVLAGYLGGIVDAVIMRITLIFQAFPGFILAVAVAGMMGPGIFNGILSLSVVYWTTYTRLGRSLVLSMKDATYIRSAKMCGASKLAIMTRYILPNAISPLVVTAALDIGNIILNMAGLSFLGLGAERPTSEWGAMMSEARNFLQTGPWGLLFPGIALFGVVVLFNFTGDCIRDTIDSRQQMFLQVPRTLKRTGIHRLRKIKKERYS